MLVDTGVADAVREIFGLTMGHTYTRIPMTAGTRTGWAETPLTPGTPETGRPCTYVQQYTIDTNDGGFVHRSEPPLARSDRDVLFIPHDDDLEADDLVADITSVEGVLMLAGPVPVVAVMNDAGFGPITNRIAVLRGAPDDVPPQWDGP